MTIPLNRVESTPSYFRPSHPKPIVTTVILGPLLILTSYAHVPPLTPAPRLKYDLRSTPNPPKSIRDAHTGISKRLREHMLDHEAFVELLEKAERDIKAKMPAAERDYKEGRFGPTTPMSPVMARHRTWSTQKLDDEEDEEEDEGDGTEEDEGDAKSSSQDAQDDDEPENERPVLRVGAFCERGQHRSVAFIEELASQGDWPKQWEVKILHRDLGKKRGSANNNKRKSHKPPVRSASIVLDDD